MKPFELTEEEIRHIIGRRKSQKLWENFSPKDISNKPSKLPKKFDCSKVTRVEVITSSGREFIRYGCSDVELSLQDEDRTLKVFLSDKK